MPHWVSPSKMTTTHAACRKRNQLPAKFLDAQGPLSLQLHRMACIIMIYIDVIDVYTSEERGNSTLFLAWA
ncbi:hypothetical protein PM082_015793 [Marasmius tenuissimus]|nr:hypothetical protein PM082_015793 [Marasmius tenuissimus]